MSRRVLRHAVISFATGVLLVGVAMAGIVAPGHFVRIDDGVGAGRPFSLVSGAPLGEGTVRVGASAVSIAPRPDLARTQGFGDAVWLQGEENRAACTTLSESILTEAFADPSSVGHLATATTSPWPENPDCLYQGGFGLGPVNPILGWDRAPGDPGYDPAAAAIDGVGGLGLWVRSVVISDGVDELVLTVIDAEGFLYEYANKCGPSHVPARCGAGEIARRVGATLGIDPSGFVIASTHSHASPDLLGGWGFVPDWYFNQVYDAIETSITRAHAGMVDAHLEVGEELAREFNGDRRSTYRSAEEQQLSWLRAVAADDPTRTIATVGAYAAHPTSYGNNDGIAHADWPGVFEAELEERFGGVALHLMTGLGNMSHRGGRENAVGEGAERHSLASLVPAVGRGTVLTDTDVQTAAQTWSHPVTNAPLNALGLPGFFDRTFRPVPATVLTGKEPETAPCASASPSSVVLQAGAARIGQDLAITSAPGEVFSNLTNTFKEGSGALVTMPLAQANDALGYMPQQFELNEANLQGAGFVADGFLIVNYEDSYAVDRCVGDMVLETTLDLLDQLAAE